MLRVEVVEATLCITLVALVVHVDGTHFASFTIDSAIAVSVAARGFRKRIRNVADLASVIEVGAIRICIIKPRPILPDNVQTPHGALFWPSGIRLCRVTTNAS